MCGKRETEGRARPDQTPTHAKPTKDRATDQRDRPDAPIFATNLVSRSRNQLQPLSLALAQHSDSARKSALGHVNGPPKFPTRRLFCHQ